MQTFAKWGQSWGIYKRLEHICKALRGAWEDKVVLNVIVRDFKTKRMTEGGESHHPAIALECALHLYFHEEVCCIISFPGYSFNFWLTLRKLTM